MNTTTNYGIDDQHGNRLHGGIQSEEKARELAQRLANERRENVSLYADGADGSETIEPEPMEWTTAAPSVSQWETPAKNQGQMVEYSYGYDEGGCRWERRHDRAEQTVEYRVADAE